MFVFSSKAVAEKVLSEQQSQLGKPVSFELRQLSSVQGDGVGRVGRARFRVPPPIELLGAPDPADLVTDLGICFVELRPWQSLLRQWLMEFSIADS